MSPTALERALVGTAQCQVFILWLPPDKENYKQIFKQMLVYTCP